MLQILPGRITRQYILPVHILALHRYSKLTSQGKGVTKVTEGVHNLGPFNLKSGVLVSQLTSMSMAPELSTVDMKSVHVKQITSINKNIYDNIRMGKVEEKYIKTKDNKDLQMWVIYPPDFDPDKEISCPAFLRRRSSVIT